MRISDWSSDVCSSDLVRHLEHWSLWPVRASLLTGPPKSGRSHLGRIFQHWSSGDVIDDADLADEQMIFHAWNRAQELRRPLLIIASAAPPLWQIALPDLASRLKATPSVAIGAPDDARSEEHTSELQSLMRISYAVFCLKKKKKQT